MNSVSDARTGRQDTADEAAGMDASRTKTFKVDGHHIDAERQPPEVAIPFMPPEEVIFNMMFFRHLFDHMAKASGSGSRVSLVALRNMSYTIMEIMQVGDPQTENFFGNVTKKKCKWKDMCKSLMYEGHPKIHLTTVERIFITLDHDDSSKMAKVWFHFIMVVTIANVTVFIFPQLLVDLLTTVGSDAALYTMYFKNICMTVFTVDYLLKMVCAPFVRLEALEPSLEYFDFNSWTNRPLSRWERFAQNFKQSSNVIDLLAVLPWWCDMLFGHFLPAASFLRILRLARVFRIFKSVRHLDMMQVLGLTLWKSMGMVAIVFTMITIIGLIASCLLQQLEQDAEVFDSVMSSWYWTFCRLIGMKDTPYRAGKVVSYWGIAILACTLTLKGVLWIVPIERIKQIFSKEYADVVEDKNLQSKVVKEVKEILEGSQETVEHFLKDGPASYTCAMLTVHTKEGAVQSFVPLPITKKSVVDNTGSELSLALGSDMQVSVRIKWVPNERMDDLPFGQLVLAIVEPSKLPPLAEVQWEVLTGANHKETETVTLDSAKSEKEVRFDIQWMPSRAIERNKVASNVEHHVHDLDEFQVQVLQMLYAQEELIEEQKKKMANQNEQLAAVSSRRRP